MSRRSINPDLRTLRSQVLAALREELVSGSLRPGERVNEVQVAEQLGVSRGTLREAIRNLEQEGLLETIPHRGTFVRALSPEEVTHVYEVRASLESRAARSAAQHLDAEMGVRLQAALERLARADSPDATFQERLDADLEFHETICEASGNPVLVRIWRSLVGQITAVMLNAGPQMIRRLQSRESHQILLDAIEGGDDATILAAFQEHFTYGAEQLTEAMRQREREGRRPR
jgi:DNA-binding GntR family transcriptional regulator